MTMNHRWPYTITIHDDDHIRINDADGNHVCGIISKPGQITVRHDDAIRIEPIASNSIIIHTRTTTPKGQPE